MLLSLVLHESPDGGVTVRASLVQPGGRIERSAPLGAVEASDASLGPALFSPPIADLLTQALTQGTTALHLQIEVAGLSARRWDRVTAPIDGEWRPLCTHPQVHLRRTVPSARSVPPRARSRSRQRALVLVAGPPGLADYALEPFDTEAALRSVLGALDGLPVTLLAEGGAQPPSAEALFERLAAEEPTLLHIIAHGRHLPRDGDAALYLSGPKGTAVPLRGRTLVERLAALPARPALVFLTACESAVAGADKAYGNLAERLIAEAGVSQVVAMADKVTVATALALHRGFYQRLLDHGDAGRALSDALAALADRPDLTVPGLWSRPGAGPLFGVVEEGSLTDEERRDGLQRLARALPDRAPTASAELADLRADAASELGRARIKALCEEVLELRFVALATGAPLPPYEVCCPFLGLHAFDEAHARFFFGRGELITALAARLAAHPFLAVLGPSGSGKSSVVRAGLVPLLKAAEPGLGVYTFTPGEAPDRALLRRPASARLVVVDQLEEAFTLAPAEAAHTFFATLLSLPADVRVIVTMRADFWGKVASEPALAQEMSAHQALVGPLRPAELGPVMEAQAASVGLRFDSGLPQRIVEQLQAEPGAMPLLQHALRELWARRRGRWLRNAAYDALGGVSASIARSAEALFEVARPAEQAHLRRIFLRLTRLGDASAGEQDTRRRARKVDLLPTDAEQETVSALIDRLVELRLLVAATGEAGEETLEVAHEALIRRWPRLRQWINDDREALAIAEELRRSALDWSRQGEHPTYLEHRGRRAEALAPSLAAGLLHPDPVEQRYLQACAAADAAEAAAAEAAQQARLVAAQNDALRARRTTRLAVALAALTVIAAIVVALLAIDARESGVRAADEARVARASLLDPGSPLRGTLLREVKQAGYAVGWMGQVIDVLLRPRAAVTRGTLRGEARGLRLTDEKFDLYVTTHEAVERWTVDTSSAAELWPIPEALQFAGVDRLLIDEAQDRWLLSRGTFLWSPWLGRRQPFTRPPLDLALWEGALLAALPTEAGFVLDRHDPFGFAEPTRLLGPYPGELVAMQVSEQGLSLLWTEGPTALWWKPPVGPPLLVPRDHRGEALRLSPSGEVFVLSDAETAEVWGLVEGRPRLYLDYPLEEGHIPIEVTEDRLLTLSAVEGVALQQQPGGSPRLWTRGQPVDPRSVHIDDDSGELAGLTAEGGVSVWPAPRTLPSPRQPIPLRLGKAVYVDTAGFLAPILGADPPSLMRWSPGQPLEPVPFRVEAAPTEAPWRLPPAPSPRMLVRRGEAAWIWRPFAGAIDQPIGLRVAAAWAGAEGELHLSPTDDAVLALREGEARLYALDTGILRETVSEDLRGAEILFRPDGEAFLATAPRRPPLLYWFGQEGRSIHLGRMSGPAVFSPQSRLLAMVGPEGATLFNARNGERQKRRLRRRDRDDCVPADFSDDDEALLLICEHTDLVEWDLTEADDDPTAVTTPIGLLSARYSPGGAAVLAAGEASLILWPPGADTPAIPLSPELARAAAFVGDGQTLRVLTPTADVIDLPLAPASLIHRLWEGYPQCVPAPERARTLNEKAHDASLAFQACEAERQRRGLGG